MVSKEAFTHYLTGMPELELQHWELISTLDQMQVYQATKDISSLNESHERFYELLAAHAVFEEQLMKDISFPYSKYHITQHPETTGILTKYRTYSGTMLEQIDITAMSFALLTHVDYADRQIGDWYIEQKNILVLDSTSN